MKMQEEKNEILDRSMTDPDFINSRKHSFSLKKFISDNPKPMSDNSIAKMLGTTKEVIEQEFQKIILKARQSLGVEVD